MEWQIAFLIVTVVMLLLLLIGQWIALALGTAGVILILIDSGLGRTATLGSIAWNSVNSFVLTAIPLFIFMGEVILNSGVSARFYRGVSKWLESVPGGLLHSNIAASSIFAAISGSSVATTAAIGTVALPEMDRRGYDRTLTLSSLSGGGSVGMLIPPSIAALIYAAMVEVSASQLFMAGLVPGLLLSLIFAVYIAVRVLLNPSLVPARGARVTWGERWRGALEAAPILVLMVLVMGSIYTGVATATEAGALGAAGALVVSAIWGKLDVSAMRRSVERSVKTSAMLIFIIVGAQILSFSIVNSNITRSLVQWIVGLGLPSFGFFLLLVVLYVGLGMVVDGLSMMLLTLPVIYPIVIEFGYDPLVFGVLLIVFIELGQITPPVGLDLFVLQGIARDSSMATIIRAATPIALLVVLMALLVYLLPQLSLWMTQFV